MDAVALLSNCSARWWVATDRLQGMPKFIGKLGERRIAGAGLTNMFPPQRIVCLTEETVETLYLLGEENRIVGISGYVVRPPQARREKPRVSAFTSANIDKIL